jgi:hypothetical protein
VSATVPDAPATVCTKVLPLNTETLVPFVCVHGKLVLVEDGAQEIEPFTKVAVTNPEQLLFSFDSETAPTPSFGGKSTQYLKS